MHALTMYIFIFRVISIDVVILRFLVRFSENKDRFTGNDHTIKVLKQKCMTSKLRNYRLYYYICNIYCGSQFHLCFN